MCDFDLKPYLILTQSNVKVGSQWQTALTNDFHWRIWDLPSWKNQGNAVIGMTDYHSPTEYNHFVFFVFMDLAYIVASRRRSGSSSVCLPPKKKKTTSVAWVKRWASSQSFTNQIKSKLKSKFPPWSVDGAQLVDCWPSMHQALGSIPRPYKSGIERHASNPSTRRRIWLYGRFEDSLCYIGPCIKTYKDTFWRNFPF